MPDRLSGWPAQIREMTIDEITTVTISNLERNNAPTGFTLEALAEATRTRPARA